MSNLPLILGAIIAVTVLAIYLYIRKSLKDDAEETRQQQADAEVEFKTNTLAWFDALTPPEKAEFIERSIEAVNAHNKEVAKARKALEKATEEREASFNDTSSDYSGGYSGGSNTYVAPVPVTKTPRAKPVSYSVYIRNRDGYERKYTTVDRAAQAVQMAQTQVKSNANRGCFIRVAGSDGSTIWTGQA
jgi:outer membrane protein TolC